MHQKNKILYFFIIPTATITMITMTFFFSQRHKNLSNAETTFYGIKIHGWSSSGWITNVTNDTLFVEYLEQLNMGGDNELWCGNVAPSDTIFFQQMWGKIRVYTKDQKKLGIIKIVHDYTDTQ